VTSLRLMALSSATRIRSPSRVRDGSAAMTAGSGAQQVGGGLGSSMRLKHSASWRQSHRLAQACRRAEFAQSVDHCTLRGIDQYQYRAVVNTAQWCEQGVELVRIEFLARQPQDQYPVRHLGIGCGFQQLFQCRRIGAIR